MCTNPDSSRLCVFFLPTCQTFVHRGFSLQFQTDYVSHMSSTETTIDLLPSAFSGRQKLYTVARYLGNWVF
jgi:hypothetical protein